VFMYYVLA